MTYIRGFLVLFMLLTLLLYLVPGDGFRRYIRFFAEILLTLGFLSPVLSLLFDSEDFLKKIEYEAFAEGLSELAKDTQKIEFLQNSYYIEEYERAIEMDVTAIAEQHDFMVKDVEVHLTDTYVLDAVSLTVEESGAGEIIIEKIEAKGAGTDSIKEGERYSELRSELSQYYRIDEEQIEIK